MLCSVVLTAQQILSEMQSSLLYNDTFYHFYRTLYHCHLRIFSLLGIYFPSGTLIVEMLRHVPMLDQ